MSVLKRQDVEKTAQKRAEAIEKLQSDIDGMGVADRRELLASLIVLNNIKTDVDLSEILNLYEFDPKRSSDESYVKEKVESLDIDQRIKLTTALILAIQIDHDNENLLKRKGVQVDPILSDEQDIKDLIRRERNIGRRAILGVFATVVLAEGAAELIKHFSLKGVDAATALIFNNEGIVTVHPSTGHCSFAGDGTRTPYDLGFTNRFADMHIAFNETPFGYCGHDMGGSKGNYIAALLPGNEYTIATGQSDVFHILKEQGYAIDDIGTEHDMSALMPLIRPDDENCFESAIIATGNPALRTLTGIKRRIEAATEDDPFVIAVPSAMSGSFMTARNMLDMAILNNNPDLEGKYRFVHLSAADRITALRGGNDFVPAADIQISVQYPGRVQGEIRSTMKRILDDGHLHFVSITPNEFNDDFSQAGEFNYHLRSVPIHRPAREGTHEERVTMLSMGVVVAARNPATIQDFEARQSASGRNDSFVAQYRANPALFDFDAHGETTFPILMRPENYQQEASLEVAPQAPNLNRRAFFGGGPSINFG